MSERLRTVTAADGRALGVARWGDPDGTPVLSLHGTPGSRLGRHPDEDAVRRAGIDLITYDRPGYGASDRMAGRRVVDCVGDVEAVLDALGLSRVAVTGRSGGGPHALAVAARLPDRVVVAECVVGVAPFDAAGLDWTAGMDAENVTEFGWARQGEKVLHRELVDLAAADLARMTADPEKVFSDDWQLADADRQVLARDDVQRTLVEATREAFRRGVEGWVDDDLAFLRPWGFDVTEIRVPVIVRYGRRDVMVPAAHGAWLADHVPGATTFVDDEAGHLADPEITLDRLAALAAGVRRDRIRP
ncbi:alpha/beta fold hydrolase [Actinoplanes sp. NPDC051633]|uniref:alpha/beta fold hydrolase n=1 Tax=Actinoplanes sp. NPDC051633 TaxID=3155670 RepID=UPI003412D6C7